MVVEKKSSNRWSSFEYEGVLNIRKRMMTAKIANAKGAIQSSGDVSKRWARRWLALNEPISLTIARTVEIIL